MIPGLTPRGAGCVVIDLRFADKNTLPKRFSICISTTRNAYNIRETKGVRYACCAAAYNAL